MDGPLVQRTPFRAKGQRTVIRYSRGVGSLCEIEVGDLRPGPRRSRPMVVSEDVTLRVARSAHLAMLAHALDGLPHEACGLLVGPAGGDDVVRFLPCENAAASAKVYTIS